MSPEHPRLAAILQDATTRYGDRESLAKALRINSARISNLINGRRFITMPEALKVEKLLGFDARSILVEAATLRIDEELPKARAGMPKKRKKAKVK